MPTTTSKKNIYSTESHSSDNQINCCHFNAHISDSNVIDRYGHVSNIFVTDSHVIGYYFNGSQNSDSQVGDCHSNFGDSLTTDCHVIIVMLCTVILVLVILIIFILVNVMLVILLLAIVNLT